MNDIDNRINMDTDAQPHDSFNGVDGSTVIRNPTTLEFPEKVHQSNFDRVRDAPLSFTGFSS